MLQHEYRYNVTDREWITVTYRPEIRSPLSTLHACWVADNGRETAVFATKDEAIAFCVKRWRRQPDRIDERGGGGR